MRSPTVKDLGAAVLGYAVMFAVAFIPLWLTLQALGVEGSFKPGSWEATGAWMAASTGFGVLVSAVGGFTCSRVADSNSGVAILIGLVVVVGLLGAVFGKADPGLRLESVTMLDTMISAQLPTWLEWINPAFSAFGVAVGAGLDSIFGGGLGDESIPA